jgi:hypothetical protein
MMLMTAIHRRPGLIWPLLPLSTVLLLAGLFLLV